MKQYPCTIKDGKLTLDDRDRFVAAVKRLKDGCYLLSLSRPGKVRSQQANGWYWAGLREIADEAGYDDPNELHEVFKARFLSYSDENGHPRIGSTATLTTHEFLTYMEKINRLCLEMFNMSFPLPKGAFDQ